MLRYRRRIWKGSHTARIVLLLVALCLPLAGMFHHREEETNLDRRKLAEMPLLRLNLRSLREFPRRFEMYFNDHFGGRGRLITWNNHLKLHALGVSSSPSVLLGLDGWLYFLTQPVHRPIKPFTSEQLEAWRSTLEHRQSWLARRGCRYLLVLPPTKQTIYPEYLPPITIPYAGQSRLDQLVEHLHRHSTVPVVDVREALRQAKKTDRLYHKTDSHWNGHGAFVCYEVLARRLSEWFPAIVPLPRSSFREVVSPLTCDLTKMLGETNAPPEEALFLEPLIPRRAWGTQEVLVPADLTLLHTRPFATQVDDPRLPRAVMFHDSFNNSVQPYLSEHFRRIAYYWVEGFHPWVVEHEHPDVVIQEIVEWKLNVVNPDDSVE